MICGVSFYIVILLARINARIQALIPHYGDYSGAALGLHSVALLQIPNLQYAYSVKIETASLKP